MKNIRKAIAALIALAMVFAALPAYVPAASSGSVIDLSDSTTTSGTGWTFSNGVYMVKGNVTITGSTGSANKCIVISGGAKDSPLVVTLDNAIITPPYTYAASPVRLNEGTYATLRLNNHNTVTSVHASFPGIETTGAYLTIEAGETQNGDTPTLDVTGGDNAAGIGGRRGDDYTGPPATSLDQINGKDGGAVTVNGGEVTATSAYGAGIGGGCGGVSTINITLLGLTIPTPGPIGSGGGGGTVIVNAGSVKASSTATTNGGAGIGGGCGGNNGLIGGIGGAGGNGGTVVINGGTVTATSNSGGAGIGGGAGNKGNQGKKGDTASCNPFGQNGSNGTPGGDGGSGGKGSNVTVNGGTVLAESKAGGAGIGGGAGGQGGQGGESGWGCYTSYHGGTGGRGGDGGSGDSLIINGGTITAISASGSGIGAGFRGDAGARGEKGSGDNYGSPGSPGSPGGTGSLDISPIPDYVWWANTANTDPGGSGMRYPPKDSAFPSNSAVYNTYKYVKIGFAPALTWNDIRNQNPITPVNTVKTDLILPAGDGKGKGNVINWGITNVQGKSDAITISGTAGIVSRAEYPQDDTLLTLTASITNGSHSMTVPFNLTVPTVSWDDYADTSWYSGDSYTFMIQSAEQLAGLARLVKSGDSGNGLSAGDIDGFSGKTLVLADDIDLSALAWNPVGTENTPFKGTFDGNGHIISGLKFVNNAAGRKGLFGYNEGNIVNTGVADVNIKDAAGSGGIAAVNSGDGSGVRGLIQNCFVTGVIVADKSGGLVGSNSGGFIVNGYFGGGIAGSGSGGAVGTAASSGAVKGVYYSAGPGRAVGSSDGKSVLSSVGSFTGTGGDITFEGSGGRFGGTLLEALNACADENLLDFDWLADPGKNGGYPIFDPGKREDRVAIRAGSHSIVVNDYNGRFVENADVVIGGKTYITGRFGSVNISDAELFGLNRVTVIPSDGHRKGEAYYVLMPGQTRNIFLEDAAADGAPYIMMAVDTDTYLDVRSSYVTYTEHSGDMLNLLVSGDNNGNGNGQYKFMLYQSGGKYIYSDDSGLISFAPGLEFAAGEPVWLRMVSDADGAPSSDFVPVYIKVIPGNSLLESAQNSVSRQPQFTVTPKGGGELDGAATDMYPASIKLPVTAMATSSSSLQRPDGTFVLRGYIGKFKTEGQITEMTKKFKDPAQLIQSKRDEIAKDINKGLDTAIEKAQDDKILSVLKKFGFTDEQISQVQTLLNDAKSYTASAEVYITKITDLLIDKLSLKQMASFFNELGVVDIAVSLDNIINVANFANVIASDDMWNQFKNDFDKAASAGTLGAADCMSYINSKYGLEDVPFTVIPGLITGSVGGVGYFEMTFDAYGNQISSGGGVIVNGFASGSKSWPFTAGPVPMKFTLGGSLGLGVAVKTALNAAGGGVTYDGEVMIAVNPGISVAVGAGVESVAYVEVSGQAGLNIYVLMNGGNVDSAGKITASAKLKAELLWLFKWSWSLGSYSKVLWGNSGLFDPRPAPAMAAMAMASYSSLSPIDASGGDEPVIEMAPRDYADKTTLWNGEWDSGGGPLQSYVLPGAVPTLSKVGNKTVMIFQADDGVSPTGDNIRLMYSVLDNGVWSEPRPVWETGTSDFAARTLAVNGDLYLIWQKSKAKLSGEPNGGGTDTPVGQPAEPGADEPAVNEPAVQAAGEPTGDTVDQTSSVITGDTVDQTAGEPAGDTVDQTSDVVTGDTVDQTTSEPTGDTADQTAGEPGVTAAPEQSAAPLVQAAGDTGTTDPEVQAMMDSTLSNMEICCAKWDDVNECFVDQAFVTDNSVTEMNPVLAANGNSITALWTEVRDGDPFGQNGGTYAVMSSALNGDTWSEPATQFTTGDYITELAAGYVGGELEIAYAIAGRDEKPDILLRHGQINMPISHDKTGSGLQFSGGKFYWLEDGSLYGYDENAEQNYQVITADGAPISGPFKLLDNGTKQAVVWSEPNPAKYVTDPSTGEQTIDPAADSYVIKASIQYEGKFGPPVTLKTVDDELSNIDVALTDQGVWQFAMNSYTAADDGNDEHSLCYAEAAPKTDIALDYVYADYSEAMDGVQPVSLTVRNTGDTPVSNVAVSLNGAASTESVKLAPGASVILRRDVDLREMPDSGQLLAEVYTDGDCDPANNHGEITLGLVDASLDVSQYRLGDSILVTAEISNSSPIETSAAVIARANDENGNPLEADKRFIFTDQNSVSVYYRFDADKLGGVDSIFIGVQTDKADANRFNNSATIPVYGEHPQDPVPPVTEIDWVPADGVSVSGDSVFYKNGGSGGARLYAQVSPDTASDRKVRWISSDESVAFVDNEGGLTLVNPGTALITAITKDGGYSDSMEITVREGAYTLAADDVFGGYVTVSGANLNGVKLDGAGLDFAGGDALTLEAVPYPGYRFVHWSDADSGLFGDNKSSPVDFTMPNENTTITPYFKPVGKNPILKGISVRPPAKTEYYEGERLDLTGMYVTADYDEDSGVGVSGYTVTPPAGTVLTRGDTAVTVSYTENGKTFTSGFDITINDHLLQSITVEAPGNALYIEGDYFDPSGLVVTAHFTDGSYEVSGYTLDPSADEPLTTDTKTITVSYTEGPVTATASFDIEVFKRIDVTGVKVGNNQATVYFNIHSANGAGYKVYLVNWDDWTDGEQITPYSNLNYQSGGVHIRGLTNGKVYTAYITYSVNGVVTEYSKNILIGAPNNANTYYVTFVDWDGTVLDTQTVNAGGAAAAPVSPTREGYTFKGWDADFSNITADLIVTAQYEKASPGGPAVVSVTPTASVNKLSGNKNGLTITVTEKLSDGTANTIKETFSINNNSSGTFAVGTYNVYVSTTGNSQVSACYIIK